MRFSSSAISSVASYTKMADTSTPPASPSKEDETKKTATTSNNSNPKKFETDGMVFKGKLIGIEELSMDRDEKVCLDSMFKLKAVVRARGEHKQKIQLNLTMSAVKIIDDTTKLQVASHEIERISFVVVDPRDTRAFGYIFNTVDDHHQFWAIKTERAAAATVLALKELFDLAFEQFSHAEKDQLEANKSTTSAPVSPSNQVILKQEPSQNIPDSSVPSASTPVVPTATETPSLLDDDLLGTTSTPTITQTTSPVSVDLLDINAPPVPIIRPAPKIVDPLELIFGELLTTQQPVSTNTTSSLLDLFPNTAPPPSSNPFVNFSPQPVNLLNTTSTLPQLQQPFAPTRPPPPQPQQQDLLIPTTVLPVAPPTATNPFAEFDFLGDLSSETATKTTKESFFPVVPPSKTIQQLQMEKQRNPFYRS